MKVNISGRGQIPGLGRLAPVRGVELSEMDIRRLINFHQFKVYNASTGKLIMKNNIDEIFKPTVVAKPSINIAKPVETPKVEVTIVEPEIKEEPIVEVKPSFLSVTEIKTETAPEVEKQITEIATESVVEEVVEDVVAEEVVDVVEEEVKEEEVKSDVVEEKHEYPRYNKKKNKYNKHQS